MLTKLYPAKLENDALQPAKATSSGKENFLKKTAHIGDHHGRIILAIDATGTRQAIWDQIGKLQATMFVSGEQKTGLSVQLVYYRGSDECRASKWVSNAQSLYHLMGNIRCEGNIMQLSKVLSHSGKEHSKKRVSALVFIGDTVTEDVETLKEQATKLAKQGFRAIMVQDGIDSHTEKTFRAIAEVTNGAFLRFDQRFPKPLEEALSAAAMFATGGIQGLVRRQDMMSQDILRQIQDPTRA